MEETLAMWTITLIFFTAWLSYLTQKLGSGLKLIESSDEGVGEIGEALTQVITLLQQLPEFMKSQVQEYIPEFHINQQGPSWVNALIEHMVGKQENDYSASTAARDVQGRFIDATTEKET